MVKVRYEITRYHLLILFAVAVFTALLIGCVLGGKIGYAEGIDNVEVDSPEYCSVSRSRGNITISCTELEGVSAEEMCAMLSTPIKSKLKVLVVS